MITCHRDYLLARCRERGYRVSEVLPCIIKREGEMLTVDPTSPHYPHPRAAKAPAEAATPAGAGTALKGLLKLIGITSSPTCKCNARARTMDSKGLQWCRDNEELIAGANGWLAEEAAKRSLPYVPFAGKKLLKLAIYRGSKYPDARP
jgi:hypothetical protein